MLHSVKGFTKVKRKDCKTNEFVVNRLLIIWSNNIVDAMIKQVGEKQTDH